MTGLLYENVRGVVLSCEFRPTVILFLKEEVPTYLRKGSGRYKDFFEIDDNDDDG